MPDKKVGRLPSQSLPCPEDGMLICGQHLLRPSAITALKQVRSQTDDRSILFIVQGWGITETIFLTQEAAMPLFKHWGINMEGLAPPKVFNTPPPVNRVPYGRGSRR